MSASRMPVRGFTLIELMIVVAIVAALAMVAMPSYTEHVQRGKVAEALAALADGRTRMEQWFQDNKTYVGGPCPAPTKSFGMNCASTATSYSIRATGLAGMAAFSYAIDESNNKTSNTPWKGAQGCWITSRSDAC